MDPAPGDRGNLAKMEALGREVDELKGDVQTLIGELKKHTTISPHKPLLKPRDVPILELSHLQGVEGESRLRVFFSQVKECSLDDSERQKIVLTRVDAKLAVYIQSVCSKEDHLTWTEFKQHLISELTDLSYSKILDTLNDLRYHYTEDPVDFVT